MLPGHLLDASELLHHLLVQPLPPNCLSAALVSVLFAAAQLLTSDGTRYIDVTRLDRGNAVKPVVCQTAQLWQEAWLGGGCEVFAACCNVAGGDHKQRTVQYGSELWACGANETKKGTCSGTARRLA